MTEKPLERLNYYNGQRLEASDLKLEQEYHIRVRRWLNRSLYSAGIAEGLEVRAEKGAPAVVVSPGLALDAEGHEIILWEEERVVVVGDARHRLGTASEAEVEGLYLTIRYDELLTAVEQGGCVPAPAKKNGNGHRAASGGPSRVLAKPLFAWRAFLPHEGSGEVVLAQVELTDNCQEVHQINADVRRYVGAASAAKVRQYALEGERDVAFIPKALFPVKPGEPAPVDTDLRAQIYFHVRGRTPNGVILYLRGDSINPLLYSEMGRHDHSGTLSGDVGSYAFSTDDTKHRHAAGDAVDTLITQIEKDETFSDGVNTFQAHTHYLYGTTGNTGSGTIGANRGFGSVNTNNLPQVIGNGIGPDDVGILEIRWGRHRHDIEGNTAESSFQLPTHTHSLNGISAAISMAGVDLPARARNGAPLTYLDDLDILIGRPNQLVSQRDAILRQLADSNPNVWGGTSRIGNGASTHPLVAKGSGPIRLDFLPGLQFTEGEYLIEFRVKAGAGGEPNGGRILYNLYVE